MASLAMPAGRKRLRVGVPLLFLPILPGTAHSEAQDELPRVVADGASGIKQIGLHCLADASHDFGSFERDDRR